MDKSQLAEIAILTTEAALAGHSGATMLAQFCERAVNMGLPLAGGLVFIDTLHPIFEGHVIRWVRGGGEATVVGYGRTNEGEAAENWRRTSFYHLVSSGGSMLRRRIDAESVREFPNFARERDAGMTESISLITRFGAEGVIGEMNCVYSQWVTDRPRGFDDGDVATLERLVPFLAVAIKSASLSGMVATVVETYLGRGAGRLVLSGRIARGIADRIEAVLWFSDLRAYTQITDTAPPEQIIPLLNDYAEAVVSAVDEAGGDVLKLIGDGVLAIFRADDAMRACRAALEAALAAEGSIARLNERREASRRPTTHMYLGLHIGEVFFGNIGATKRLDFTVVGPAVNEVSRIVAMCRSVERNVLTSTAFARALGDGGPRLVSVGRYALRGVGRPQELFTLDR